MADHSIILRAITSDGSAFIHACDSTAIVAKAHEIHETSKTMTAALGRALTAACLMGAQLKSPSASLTLQFQCTGPAKNIVCVSDSTGNVKGYTDHPEVELPPNAQGKLNVGGALGGGTLHVIRDPGQGEPYVGLCQLATGEIAEDITAYYAQSEQIPTACALGVRVNRDLSVKSAGGFLLQLLPGADEQVIAAVEKNIADVGSVSRRVAQGDTPLQIVQAVLAGIPFEVLDESPVDYVCGCSRQRYARILATLNRRDLQSLIDGGEEIETVCNFCRKRTTFSVEELKQFLKNKDQ